METIEVPQGKRKRLNNLTILVGGLVILLGIVIIAGYLYINNIINEKISTMKNEHGFKKEYINSTPGYTNVVSITNGNIKTLYIAGQVGSGDTLEEQIRTSYQGIIDQLKAAGAEFSDVVKITAYIVNYSQEDLPLFKKVRLELFENKVMPAITIVGVSALALDNMKVEMEAVAVVPLGE